MRQWAIALAAVCICTLFGCTDGKNAEDMLEPLRLEYENAETMTTYVKLTADYSDRVYDYELVYAREDGVSSIELRSPESIAGLRAEFSDETASMEFDGMQLDTGALFGSVTPLEALPLMYENWISGFVESSYLETMDGTRTLVLSQDLTGSEAAGDEDVELCTWFDAVTYLPVRAELRCGNRCVVTCVFGNVVLE